MLQDLYWQDVFAQTGPNVETRSNEPTVTEGILEVTQLEPGGHLVYAFEMSRGQSLHFSVAGDQGLDLVVCTFVEYERWLDSIDSDVEIEVLGGIDGLPFGSVSYQAELDDEIIVVISNSSEQSLQALVEAMCT